MGKISCYVSLCTFTHASEERMLAHVMNEHKERKKLKTKVLLFPALVASSLEIGTTKASSQALAASNSSIDSAEPSSVEWPSTETRNLPSFRPTRERQPHLQMRPTPYQRTGDSSSQSSSPVRRSSVGTLSL